ncbi:MAG: ABC transporter ATP-binding protein [Sulfobacillus benefaciens]|uniref:ABC transporter ATP-binding protein n=1 Tax=Sulfobacillus benefaciens TaxID=453960 RepID=A0A2T2XIQ8_9FIRM|nr:MAG: ABC transporter ATP-binding protein [Sulfobacillus benefaciens]
MGGGCRKTYRRAPKFRHFATHWQGVMSVTETTQLAAPEPWVEVCQLTVTYPGQDTPALRNIDFSLFEGEAVLVIGPSGSGKSTLAMVLAGLIPESVEATITGQIRHAPILQQPGAIGYVFQDPEAQFCQLTVGQEIAFGLENIGCQPSEMPTRIKNALDTAGLAIDTQAPNYALSGGMKQKLALAADLAMDPKFLIFDEPTANLDPEATSQVFAEIGRLIRSGRTVLIIEHKFEALLDIVPHLVIIDRLGQIRDTGPTRDVIRREWDWMMAEGLIPEGLSTGFGRENLIRQRGAGAVHSEKPILQAKDVSYTYVSKRLEKRLKKQGRSPSYALRRVSLDICGGELVAIVGPNGSGKSTLLNLLAGLSKPTQGVITLPPAQPGMIVPVAFGFQNPEHQFIFERVADELANRFVDLDIPDDVQSLLQDFALQGQAEQSPFALSQGQKRRLSVAVMMRDPHLAYLLDEPTFGQDARTEQYIMTRLAALKEQGKAVVLTTHDMDLVWRYATRVVVLVSGQVIFDGPPQDLFYRTDIMSQAHLLVASDSTNPDDEGIETPKLGHRFIEVDRRQAQSPIGRLNPGWKLVTTILAMGIAMFARNINQGIALGLIPLVLLWAGAWLTPWQIIKRMSPFVIFFALYTWTLTAYSRVGPHTPTFWFLWYRLSWVGLDNGLVLAFRMLASVAFGILYVSTTDVTQLVVSLTQNFRVPPRFSYGTLAGIRVFPLFEEEWRKIRQARALRGKDIRRSRVTRIVTYALPLMTQAIRIGERVAVAMESRGFKGLAAESAGARTYYFDTPVTVWDFVYLAFVVILSLGILIWIR